MSDVLERAAAALSAERRPNHDAAYDTRHRVLDSLRDDQRQRRRRLLSLIPLAAVLIGTSALAADVARAVLTRGSSGEPERAAIGAVAMVARALAPAPQLAAEAPRTAAPEKTATGEGTPPPRASDDASPASRPEADPTLVLYRNAHEVHFGGGSPAEAMRLWDAYLVASPGGTFAPEAAFNRAICLLRLGRTAQAREALAPFASGRLGGYRQPEAERLLQALRSR